MNGPNGFACALTQEGRLYCWGGNTTGQLADGKVPQSSSLPQPAVTSERFRLLNENNSIIACALTSEGVAYCWGNGNPLRVSNLCPFPGGVHPCLPVPTRLNTELRFVSLTASANGGMCGITTSQEVACWGTNLSQRFGLPPSGCTLCASPEIGPTGFVSVSSSVFTTCGIARDQRAYCWGDNTFSQFAGPQITTTATPTFFRVLAAR